MADVIGVAASVAQLLEGAIRLLNRVRKAYERQQNLTSTIDKHVLELDSINSLITSIVNEDALQTDAVAFELSKLYTVGTKLVKCLTELDPRDKGMMRQLAHQLVHGTREKETLTDLMSDLDRAKADLSLRMQLANVGLTRMVHDNILANVEVVNRIDRLLTGAYRGRQVERVAGMLENSPSEDVALLSESGDNFESLDKFEDASLRREMVIDDTSKANPDDKLMDRVIAGNTARCSAVQLLGPIGKDLWENTHVRIENNSASGHAAQFAYPTDFASFKYILDHQERMAALETR